MSLLTGQTFTKSFVVAGQKFYAADFLVLIAEMQALNDEIVGAAGAARITGNETIAGVKTFSSAPVFSAGAACGSNKLTAVKDGISAQDAITKAQLDAYTPGTYDGTTITGTLSTVGSWQASSVDFSTALSGSKNYLCYLLITNNGASTIGELGLRTGGSSVDIDLNCTGPAFTIDTLDSGKSMYLSAISSSAGKFDYYINNSSITVTLLSYIKLA